MTVSQLGQLMPAGNSSERWDPIECRRERERNRGGRAAARGFTQHNTHRLGAIGRSRRRPRLLQAAPLREHACTRGGCLCSHPITPARGGGPHNNLASPRGAKRRWPKAPLSKRSSAFATNDQQAMATSTLAAMHGRGARAHGLPCQLPPFPTADRRRALAARAPHCLR